jgi:hypothetical protein
LGSKVWALGAGLWALAAQGPTPPVTSFTLAGPAEVIATIAARCNRCDWGVAGREAAILRLTLDGKYVAHLPLVRTGSAEYPILVGTVAAGTHNIRAEADPELTAAGLRAPGDVSIERIDVRPMAADDPEHTAVSLAPIIHARPNTIGRFTDVPVFMWYEREPTARGLRYRYSVVFTNEDGGTPADRLMATWGRTTDIEYVYSAEVDGRGNILAEDIQGPKHEILPFTGPRHGRHPLLWVATDNNMVLERGTTSVRYAPAPVPFPLDGVSREAVMDANPWMYRLAAQELAREGKIVADAAPGRGAIPDPRRFVYVEACGVLGDAALSFEIELAGGRSEASDRGVPEYRIVRDGCFRGAVPLPAGASADEVRALRLLAHSRPGREAAGRPFVRIDRVNTVFMLDEHHRPGRRLTQWSGPASIAVGGRLEVPIVSR